MRTKDILRGILLTPLFVLASPFLILLGLSTLAVSELDRLFPLPRWVKR